MSDKKIYIIKSDNMPELGILEVDGILYETRILMKIFLPDSDCCSDYRVQRFVRHSRGYIYWMVVTGEE